MSDYFGIGKQTVAGPATTPAIFFPCLTSTQESCHICGRIDERDRMHFVGSGGEGDALYVCDDQHTV